MTLALSPKLPLVYNPRSGSGPKKLDALLSRLPKEVRDRLQPMPMGPPWDYRPMIEAAVAAGGPLLVWGGDGTLHYAGRALMEAGCPVPLAAIPGGSGNGLVRGLRTPLDPARAIVALLQGRELRMDLGRLDGVPFLNLCGTGFEAAVAHAFDSLAGRGFSNYAKLTLRLWRTHPHLRARWTIPDERLASSTPLECMSAPRALPEQAQTVAHPWTQVESGAFPDGSSAPRALPEQAQTVAHPWTQVESGASPDGSSAPRALPEQARGPGGLRAQPGPPDSIWSVCFSNLPQYGSGLWIAPHADPTDGCLDWISLSKPSLSGLLTGVPPLFMEKGRSHLRQEGRIRSVILELEKASLWHMDGEPVSPRDRVELAAEPQCFRMQVSLLCPW